MFTRSVSASPVRMASCRAKPQRAPIGIERWTRCQTEVRSHIAVLEQATMAIFEGYLGRPLYHRAAHAAEWLLALAERLAWREGSRVAHEMTSLFRTDAAFGLVHALHLSELIAAVYREAAQASVRQIPTGGWDAAGDDCPDVPPAA